MLISTPAAALAGVEPGKTGTKTENAADDVAKGNLRQHPNWKPAPRSSFAAGNSFNQMISALNAW